MLCISPTIGLRVEVTIHELLNDTLEQPHFYPGANPIGLIPTMYSSMLLSSTDLPVTFFRT